MARLMDLPNEIVLEIINKTSAGDITSLAKCNWRLFRLSLERVAFHKRKRAEADDIVTGRYALEQHPMKHLQDILDNDDIRFYTKKMTIQSLDYDPVLDRRNRNSETCQVLIANMKSQYEHQIAALVAKVYDALLPYAIKTDLEEWTEKVLSGEWGAVVVLLLALYPYLKILHIMDTSDDWFDEGKTLEEMEHILIEHRKEAAWVNLFQCLTATARIPATNRLKVFSKISGIYMDGDDLGRSFNDSIVTIIPFMALPTNRKICCYGIDGRDVPWPYGTGTSETTDLDLSGDIDTASILNLIRGPRRLENFVFFFRTSGMTDERFYDRPEDCDRMKWGPHLKQNDIANIDPDGDSDADGKFMEDGGEVSLGTGVADVLRWEPRAITESLLQYACNSLVSLDLTLSTFQKVSNLSGDEPFIPSLRPFQVLRVVRLNTMMLFERVKPSKIVSRISRKSIQRELRKAIVAQKLIEFLPVSIEKFEMVCAYVGKGLAKSDVEAMFTGLPELKDRVPKLSRINFAWMEDWNSPIPRNLDVEREGWEELIERCEANAIEICSNGEYGEPRDFSEASLSSDS